MSEESVSYLTRRELGVINAQPERGLTDYEEEDSMTETYGTDNMSHAEAISKIRNRKVGKLLEEIDGDSQPHKLIRSIKKAFNHMANDFETYVTEITGEQDNDEYQDSRFNR